MTRTLSVICAKLACVMCSTCETCPKGHHVGKQIGGQAVSPENHQRIGQEAGGEFQKKGIAASFQTVDVKSHGRLGAVRESNTQSNV